MIILSIWLGGAHAEADPKDGPIKSTQFNSFNSIQLSTPKPAVFSYQQLAQLGKFLPQQTYQQDNRIQYETQYVQSSTPYQETRNKKQQQAIPHQVPVAMVIIAQPAYVPASALQADHIAQLLQYFRGNSAARYQLLHGNYGQQQQLQQPQQVQIQAIVPVPAATTSNQQQYYQYPQQNQYSNNYASQYQPIVQNSAVSYQNQEQPQGRAIFHHTDQQQLVSKVNDLQQNHPQQQPALQPISQPVFGQKLYPVIPHRLTQNQQQPQESNVVYEPPQHNFVEQSQTQTQTEAPYQLGHISQIAQHAAEKFLLSARGNSNVQGASHQQQPYRQAPAIFTGFENFTPEQQKKIKAQLSAHFGAPLQAIKVAGSSESSESQGSSGERA